MTTALTTPADSRRTASTSAAGWHDPAYQAFWLLRVGFFALPVLFGVDKFFNGLAFWPQYLWIGFPHLLGVSPQHFMYFVGAVEVAAGIGVLVVPRFVAYVIVVWLAGIIAKSGDHQRSTRTRDLLGHRLPGLRTPDRGTRPRPAGHLCTPQCPSAGSGLSMTKSVNPPCERRPISILGTEARPT